MDINETEVEEIRNEEKHSIDLNELNNNVCGIKENNKSNVLENESSQSDGSKTVASRDDRIKRLKEQSELERQRKIAEIIESQKMSHELRQKQQNERRKKIEELKFRDEERRKAVEQRRRELDEKDKEKTESLQKRQQEREARAALNLKPSSRPGSTSGGLMSQSLISPRSQTRMSSSIHSSGGTSSGSDKCTGNARPTDGASSSASNLVVVPDRAAPSPQQSHRHHRHHRHQGHQCRLPGAATPQSGCAAPEGYVEIEPGKFIPASTRHLGCFLPYRGPTHRVRGVLAWGPPSISVPSGGTVRRSGSEAWWAPVTSPDRHRRRRHRTDEKARAHSAHGDTRAASIHNDYDSARTRKDGPSPHGKARSSSRGTAAAGGNVMSTSAIVVHHKSSAPAMQSSRSVRAAPDDSLFDRLSKPRSGSQPPKTAAVASGSGDSGPPPSKPSMTLGGSHTALATKPARKPSSSSSSTSHSVAKTTVTQISPVSTIVSTVAAATTVVMDTDTTTTTTTEMTPSSTTGTADESPSTVGKPTAKTSTGKNLSKSPESAADVPTGSVATGEEVNYKLKLAEQRRIAREKKEEQLEEQRKIEEEARQRAALEKKRVEEETRQLIEEEAKRARLLEEEKLAELEKQRLLEEADRKKKEDVARQLEENRLEKLRIAEEARLDRKRRLEKIMSRVKRADDSSSPSNEECTGLSENASDGLLNAGDPNESVQEVSLDDNRELSKSSDAQFSHEGSPQPTRAAWQLGGEPGPDQSQDAGTNAASLRNNSPELLSDTVLNLPAPQDPGNSTGDGSTRSTAVDIVPSAATAAADVQSESDGNNPAEPPPLKFKSRLLQSMLGNSGRLSSNKDRSDDTREKRHSSYMESSGGTASAGCDTDDYMLPSGGDHSAMHHSRSYQADIGMLSDLMDRAASDRDCQQHPLVNGNTAAINSVFREASRRDDHVSAQIPDRPNGHTDDDERVDTATIISDIEDPPRLASTVATTTNVDNQPNKMDLLTEPRCSPCNSSRSSTCSEHDSTRQLGPPPRAVSHALELS